MFLTFNSLKKNLKKQVDLRHTVRIAVLGDSATQLLCTAIRGLGVEFGIAINVYEAPYNQIEAQFQDPKSELHDFRPDYVVVFESHKKLQRSFYASPDRRNFAVDKIEKVKNYADLAVRRIGAKLLYFNFCETDDAVFGSFGTRYPSSFLFQCRQLNAGLSQLAAEVPGLLLADILSLQNRYGLHRITDQQLYIRTDMVLSIDCLPLAARLIVDPVRAGLGQFKKCLILDLDNTLWGGVIGDDGINHIQIGSLGIGKAFSELQQWVRELKDRGVILCVASKNTESIAREPFEYHPEMVLKTDDIAVFMANWDNKVKNIQKIREILNIGYDSMVFLDDNPFERNIVRQQLPEITVPELPEDPSAYLGYLTGLNLFETASVSENDGQRTRQYQLEAQRVKDQQYFENADDYLRSLDMVATAEGLNAYNLPRVAQLSQRSNQFNLCTLRFDEQSLREYGGNPDHHVLSFSLCDKYGDHGLIAAVFLKRAGSCLHIDNWIMSCRVLKREMENFTNNAIVQAAREMGCTRVTGRYIPTAKNGIVSEHYQSLGYSPAGGSWHLDTTDYKPLSNYINQQMYEGTDT